MSRVIKFRAWNPYQNRMMPAFTPYQMGEIFPAQCFDHLMQFTGLTDWSGVEIYESDVVADQIGVGIVKYSDQHAGFRVMYGNGRAKWFYDYLESERKTIEVIGNIYEHPHLLNRPSESA